MDTAAEALFGPYESQYPSLGEENPLVSWEATSQGEFYLVPQRELPELSIMLTPGPGDPVWSQSAFAVQAELLRSGESLGLFQVDLISGGGLFPAHITGIAGAE